MELPQGRFFILFVLASASLAPVSAGAEGAMPGAGPRFETRTARIAPRTMELLVDVLGQGPIEDQVRAATALGKAGVSSAAFEPLRRAASSESPMVRAAAVHALARSQRPEVVAVLVKAADDPHWQVRMEGYLAMRHLAASDALSGKAVDGLADSDAAVRLAAAEAFGAIGSAADVPAALRAGGKARDPRLVAAILEAVGRRADSVEPEVLAPFLAHPARQVRAAALVAVARVAAPLAARVEVALEDRAPEVRRAAGAAWGALKGKDAVPELRGLSRDRDSTVRETAAIALGPTGSADAIGVLEEMLADEYRNVRRAASEALVELAEAHREAVAQVARKALARPHVELRIEGLFLFGKLADAALLEAGFRHLPEDRTEAETCLLLWATGICDADALGELVLDHLDPDASMPVRLQAATALGRMDYEPAAEEMIAVLLQKTPDGKAYTFTGRPRTALVRSLAQIDTPSTRSALFGRLQAPKPQASPHCVRIALEHLVEVRHEGLAGVLSQMLDEEQVQSRSMRRLYILALRELTGTDAGYDLPELPQPPVDRFFLEALD